MLGWLNRPERDEFLLLRAAASTLSLAGIVLLLVIIAIAALFLSGLGTWLGFSFQVGVALTWAFLCSLGLVVLGQSMHLMIGIWRELRRIGGE